MAFQSSKKKIRIVHSGEQNMSFRKIKKDYIKNQQGFVQRCKCRRYASSRIDFTLLSSQGQGEIFLSICLDKTKQQQKGGFLILSLIMDSFDFQ